MNLKKFSEHPIGSGLIVVFIGWLVSEVFLPDNFRLSDTWGELSRWLRRSIYLDRGELISLLALVTLLALGVAYLVMRRMWRVTVGDIVRESRARKEATKSAEARTLADSVPEPQPAAAQPTTETEIKKVPLAAPRRVPEDFVPNEAQGHILPRMLKRHPTPCSLRDLQEISGRPTNAHTQREMEGLMAANVVVLQTHKTILWYSFTRAGRDFAVKWFDEDRAKKNG